MNARDKKIHKYPSKLKHFCRDLENITNSYPCLGVHLLGLKWLIFRRKIIILIELKTCIYFSDCFWTINSTVWTVFRQLKNLFQQFSKLLSIILIIQICFRSNVQTVHHARQWPHVCYIFTFRMEKKLMMPKNGTLKVFIANGSTNDEFQHAYLESELSLSKCWRKFVKISMTTSKSNV